MQYTNRIKIIIITLTINNAKYRIIYGKRNFPQIKHT